MKGKGNLESRLWRGSLMLHGLVFTLFWALAFYTLSFTPFYDFNRSLPLIVLFWIPFLIAHIAAYFHYVHRPDTVEIERSAYREGFADGIREHNNQSNSYNNLHLSADDETELQYELTERQKRKRELR